MTQKNEFSKGMWWFVGIAVLVIVIGSLNQDPRPSGRTINAEITKYGMYDIRITNNNSFAWPSADIRLNGIPYGYRFEYLDNVMPGNTIEINLLNFTKRNGDRFQPLQTAVKEIIVNVPGCNSPIYEF